MDIFTSELLKDFKTIDVTTIHRSNAYYTQYGVGNTVENISWSGDRILDMCEESLRDNIQEGLIDVCLLELGGLLVFKLMIDIVLDVEDSALNSMAQSLQTMRLKYIPGENVTRSWGERKLC